MFTCNTCSSFENVSCVLLLMTLVIYTCVYFIQRICITTLFSWHLFFKTQLHEPSLPLCDEVFHRNEVIRSVDTWPHRQTLWSESAYRWSIGRHSKRQPGHHSGHYPVHSSHQHRKMWVLGETRKRRERGERDRRERERERRGRKEKGQRGDRERGERGGERERNKKICVQRWD